MWFNHFRRPDLVPPSAHFVWFRKKTVFWRRIDFCVGLFYTFGWPIYIFRQNHNHNAKEMNAQLYIACEKCCSKCNSGAAFYLSWTLPRHPRDMQNGSDQKNRLQGHFAGGSHARWSLQYPVSMVPPAKVRKGIKALDSSTPHLRN